MYMCSECGAVYDELPTRTDLIGYYGSEPQYETYTHDEGRCGGWIKETAICKRCEESKIEDDFQDDFCKECSDVVYKKFKQLLNENFTADEIEWLYNNWEE